MVGRNWTVKENITKASMCCTELRRLTVRVRRLASSMAGRGAAEGGDDGVVVWVGVVRVVHSWVVAIVLWGSFSDVDFRFTHITKTQRLKLASVILLRSSDDPVVVIVPLVAADHWGISEGLGKCDLPPVAHLWGPGVSQDFGALQRTVTHKARGGRAGDVVHLLAGGGDVNGELRTA